MNSQQVTGARVLSRLIRHVWALPNTLIGLLFVPTAMRPRGRVQVIDGVLEAHGPFISVILQHCVPIPGGASAITFGHVVLARDRWSLDATRAHERVHVRQYEIWGPAFIPAYLIAGLWGLMTGAGAYTGNYFERQANRSIARISMLVLAASLTAAAQALAQVPDDLRAAMRARDTAFYAADPAQWEKYTAPGFTTVQQDGSLMTRVERLANLRTQTPRPYVARSREQNERRGDIVVARFFSGGLWVLEVWTRETGTWTVLLSQVTTAKP